MCKPPIQIAAHCLMMMETVSNAPQDFTLRKIPVLKLLGLDVWKEKEISVITVQLNII